VEVDDSSVANSRIDDSVLSAAETTVPEADSQSQTSRGTGTTRTGTHKGMKLSYDEYKAMSTLIIMYMRREEAAAEEQGKKNWTRNLTLLIGI